MARVKTADILTICHVRTNNRPSWLNRGWKIIANGYARGTNNCFAGATTIAVGNPKGKEIINASLPLVTADGPYQSLSSLQGSWKTVCIIGEATSYFCLYYYVIWAKWGLKTTKKVNIIQHSPILSPFINRDKIKNFPFCRACMTII